MRVDVTIIRQRSAPEPKRPFSPRPAAEPPMPSIRRWLLDRLVVLAIVTVAAFMGVAVLTAH